MKGFDKMLEALCPTDFGVMAFTLRTSQLLVVVLQLSRYSASIDSHVVLRAFYVSVSFILILRAGVCCSLGETGRRANIIDTACTATHSSTQSHV
jgi:hypothetical protein